MTNRRVNYASPEEAFTARTKWQGDCLIWTGALFRTGYGAIKANGKTVRAHRYAWEREYGPIPQKMVLDHICWNRACVNIDHLRVVTRTQNNANRSGPQPSNRTSGKRNVYRGRGGTWLVYVKKNSKAHYFGTYETVEEAEKVAAKARQELFGEYAGMG